MKPLNLTKGFRASVRSYPREKRVQIGRALQQLEADFGHPHRHRGLGVRKLTGDLFEIRCGLDIRLVFENCSNELLFTMIGNHDEIKKHLRGL